jgi:hypothetical protein
VSDARRTIPADGVTRLTLDTTGADVSVRWVDQIESVIVVGPELPFERAGDEIFIRADLRRAVDDDDDEEIRILGYDSPGHMVEEILKQTGLFSGIGRSRRGAPLHIQLPTSITNTTLEVEQSNLSLEDPVGRVDCKLKRGDFSSSGGDAELIVSAGSGEVEISTLRGSLRVSGGSGDISLANVEAIVNIKAGSGDLTLTRVKSDAVKIAAGSGDIDIIDSRISAYSSDSGSGDVLISGGALDRISIRTGSGEVRSSAQFGPFEQSISTGSGSVSLGIPRDLSARIEAFTSSGDIDSEAPLVSVGQRGPKSRRSRRQVGSVGSGEPRAEVSLRTSSGDIRLHWLATAVVDSPEPPVPPTPPQPPRPPTPPSPGAHASVSTQESSEAEFKQSASDQRAVVLQALARGEITVDEADVLLERIENR